MLFKNRSHLNTQTALNTHKDRIKLNHLLHKTDEWQDDEKSSQNIHMDLQNKI